MMSWGARRLPRASSDAHILETWRNARLAGGAMWPFCTALQRVNRAMIEPPLAESSAVSGRGPSGLAAGSPSSGPRRVFLLGVVSWRHSAGAVGCRTASRGAASERGAASHVRYHRTTAQDPIAPSRAGPLFSASEAFTSRSRSAYSAARKRAAAVGSREGRIAGLQRVAFPRWGPLPAETRTFPNPTASW